MKNLIISLSCLLCGVALYAGTPVVLKSGDPSIMKEKTTAFIELDFSATMVGDQPINEYLKSRGDDFVKVFPQNKELASNLFASAFNKRSKGMKVSYKDSDLPYKIVVRVKNLDYGNPAGVFVPHAPTKAGGAIIDGTLEIINVSTKEIICTFTINQLQGGAHVTDKYRMGLAFSELASVVAGYK